MEFCNVLLSYSTGDSSAVSLLVDLTEIPISYIFMYNDSESHGTSTEARCTDQVVSECQKVQDIDNILFLYCSSYSVQVPYTSASMRAPRKCVYSPILPLSNTCTQSVQSDADADDQHRFHTIPERHLQKSNNATDPSPH